ncbi:hypothetical protein [Pleurocapsa sp. FMAR1]|nr:hypothetical protein [Pleurocapsa sp. FMAR1]
MPAFICRLALCSVELRQRVINAYEAKEGLKIELVPKLGFY